MDDANTELLAFTGFPRSHAPKVVDQPTGTRQQEDQQEIPDRRKLRGTRSR